MRPTEEQQSILDSKGRVLLINARAGTGKTTTLKMIATAHPDLKILYLAFNKETKKEAAGKFPRNVEVRTVHSLAYSGNASRWKKQLGIFSIADMLPAFKGLQNAQQLAAFSHDFIEFFMNSPYPKVEEAIGVFQQEHTGHLKDETKKSIQGYQNQVVQACREMLGQWYKQEKSCPHDFYLKLFHLEGNFYKVLNQFDMVLVDEGQDLSPIMLDALKHCQKRIIIVGDSHQQIYSFRYAIDAMKTFRFDDKQELTMSFRFGKKIADLASSFIQEAKGVKGFKIEGNPEKNSEVAFYTQLSQPKTGERYAVLSRTNLALFEKALDLKSKNVLFSLEGNVSAIFWRILDVYWLSERQHRKIRDKFIQSFKSLDILKKYAEHLDDFQLTGIIKVVTKHVRILPGTIFDIMEASKNTAGKSDGRSIVLSTVHGAKGQEYDRVYIDPDIAAVFSNSDSPSNKNSNEEANITYVAFTRAIKELYLPLEFKNILNHGWQKAIRRYETGDFLKTSQLPRERDMPRKPPGFSRPASVLPTTGIRESRTRTNITFKIGDRVISSNGEGSVIDVDDGKYLVALDGQSARLWEKAWGLKKK